MNTEVAELLIDIEAELRQLGLWDRGAAPPAALASDQPFSIDTLTLPQWLRFIFLPTLYRLLEEAQPARALRDRADGPGVFPGMGLASGALEEALLQMDRVLSGRTAAAVNYPPHFVAERLDALNHRGDALAQADITWWTPQGEVAVLHHGEQRAGNAGAGAAEGWPRAMAPPCTFTFSSISSSSSRSFSTGSAWAARPLFSSTISISLMVRPSFSAPFGGWHRTVAHDGRVDAREGHGLDAGDGVRPRAAAFSADMTSMAEAPSEICDEVPAVTVPPWG